MKQNAEIPYLVDESAARVTDGVTLCDGYNIDKSNEYEYLETVGMYKSITPKGETNEICRFWVSNVGDNRLSTYFLKKGKPPMAVTRLYLNKYS